MIYFIGRNPVRPACGANGFRQIVIDYSLKYINLQNVVIIMTNIRRYPEKGSIYFLTHVTYNRQSILVANFDILWESLLEAKSEYAFDLIAWVVLPDHFHLLIDPRECDLSKLMRKIKLTFSGKYRRKYELMSGRVWQYRFWDHIIRDQDDMNRHIDYIHYNPVKHGLVNFPSDYKNSSFSTYFDRGIYTSDWGVRENFVFDGDFGE
jgi:putative transposase